MDTGIGTPNHSIGTIFPAFTKPMMQQRADLSAADEI
jgi:hypothetical protein